MITGQRNRDAGDPLPTGAPRSPKKSSSRPAWAIGTMLVFVAVCLLFGYFNLINGHTADSPAALARPSFIVGVDIGNPRADLTVISAATGRTLATVQPPKGLFFHDTAATSDSRTFLVAAESATNPCETWLYELRLTQQGNAATLSPFEIPRISGQILASDDLSISADGHMMTYSAELCNAKRTGVIGVADAVSDKIRTLGLSSESAWSLSVSSDGRVIGFVNSVVYGGNGTVSLLAAAAPGALSARRVPVILPTGYRIDVNGSIAMSPDGTVLLACSEAGDKAMLAAYSARTGELLAVIHRWSHVMVAPCEIAFTPSGQYAIIYNLFLSGALTEINISTGQISTVGKGAKYPGVLGVSW
jgi:hypothetical protein